MTGEASSTMPPKLALAAIREHQGAVLVDLDETLYLRNSTEDFIDLARPAVVALILLRVLDVLRPWQLSGGAVTRDCWRVGLILLLFPATLKRWRDRVATLARRHRNRPLIQALNARGQAFIVITDGFTPIVEPLIRAMQVPVSQILAVSPPGCRQRRAGKLARARSQLGEGTLRDSLVLTDSLQDAPLLQASARPMRVHWPQAFYRPALQQVYLPGQYISRVKRPGERYILRGILQEDFAFWLLATLVLAPSASLHIAGLLCLLLSFWAVYEQGYVDNDRCGERFEAEPKLSAAYHGTEIATPRLAPWLWAAGSGTLAVTLLSWPQPHFGDFLAWAAVLLGTAAWFRLYNRYDKPTRVWLYPGLQVVRSAAPLSLVAANPIGAMGLAAHVLARSLPYFSYRQASPTQAHWPQIPVQFTRLLIFIMLAGLLGATHGMAAWANATGAALLGWNLLRARQEIGEVLASARRLDRNPSS